MASDTDVSTLYPNESTSIIVSGNSRVVKNTEEDKVNTDGWTKLLVLAGATCCLGSALPAGYNIGVINTPAYLMRAFCNESFAAQFGIQLSHEGLNVVWSTIVSIFLIGGVLGSLSAGLLADKFGRKGALIIGNLCGIIGALLFIFTPKLNSVLTLLFGRLIVGLSGGLATSLLPLYMTELAPLRLRGAVGVLCQLGITGGVLIGQIAGLDTVLGTETLWHCMLAAYLPLCIAALFITLVLPESPKYLYVIKREQDKAITELSRLRDIDIILLRNEILVFEQELTLMTATDNWNINRVIRDSYLRLPLLLVILLQFGQQLSGINAVFYYSDSIFKNAGLDKVKSELTTIGTGVANVIMAFISIALLSQFSRRSLLLTSIYLNAICAILLSFAIAFIQISKVMPWLCIIAIEVFVITYGIGLGPIPYFIGSELFEVGPRSAAMALGSVANWGGNFIIGMTFPLLQQFIGSYTFLLFATCVLLVAIFVRIYLPETRGRMTNEIASTMTEGLRSRPNNILN